MTDEAADRTVWDEFGWTPPYLQKKVQHHRTLARGNDHIADDYEKALSEAIRIREEAGR